MSANYNDTTAFPTFSGTTAKRDLIRELYALEGACPNLLSVIYRINNTDLKAGLTDGATVYAPTDSFSA